MAKIVNANEAKNLINSGELVIIDFFATWCGPCQMFLPIFDDVSNEIEGGAFLKVDIDQDTDFAGEQSVMGVPTIVVYQDGEEVSRFSGFKPADELKTFVKSFIKEGKEGVVVEDSINTSLANELIKCIKLYKNVEQHQTNILVVSKNTETVKRLQRAIIDEVEKLMKTMEIVDITDTTLLFSNGVLLEFKTMPNSLEGRYGRFIPSDEYDHIYIDTFEHDLGEDFYAELKERFKYPTTRDIEDKTFIYSESELKEQTPIKKFKVVKNTYSVCYEATEDGEITTNELHNGSVITYKKGDWICNDPNNENDIWPIEKSIHGNYTKSDI